METSAGFILFPGFGRGVIAKTQQRRTGAEALGQGLPQLFGFVGRFSASGVSGYQGGRNYHSNERKANQKIVHVFSPSAVFRPAAGLTCPRLDHRSIQ
jgi:hypothetical protein